MKDEVGILMKPELVVATMAGAKTETRRVVLPQPAQHELPGQATGRGHWQEHPAGSGVFRWHFKQKVKGMRGLQTTLQARVKPRYRVGQTLYTRETIWQLREFVEKKGAKPKTVWLGHARFAGWDWGGFDKEHTKRRADECGFGLRPGIHAPKWTSRAKLKVVGVRIERLNKITAEQCRAEGVQPTLNGAGTYVGYLKNFVVLWDRINGARGFTFEKNPWVIVYKFKLVEKPLGDEPKEAVERGSTCDVKR